MTQAEYKYRDTVNLIACWDHIRNDLLALVVIIIATTALTFATSGLVAQWIGRKMGGKDHD